MRERAQRAEQHRRAGVIMASGLRARPGPARLQRQPPLDEASRHVAARWPPSGNRGDGVPVLVTVDEQWAEAGLAAGTLTCPPCGGRLAPWGYARERAVVLGRRRPL